MAAFGATLAVAAPALASAPLGAWVKVDKVVFEPDETNATKIQVWGVFALNLGQQAGSWAYSPPQAGYMYFSCPQGYEAQCRMEWADFKLAVGTKNCSGFGQNYVAPGTVRATSALPASPDAWPVTATMGVYNTTWAGGTCDQLQNYALDGGTLADGGNNPSTDSGSGNPPADSGTGNPKGPGATKGGGGCAVAPDAAALPIFEGLALALALAMRRRRAR
jgi:hypothetical protein